LHRKGNVRAEDRSTAGVTSSSTGAGIRLEVFWSREVFFRVFKHSGAVEAKEMTMKALTGAAVLVSLAFPVMAQTTIVCSSHNNARRVCPANTRNGVVLVRERSDGVCQQGSTWGYNSRGIYVSGGCSAEFQVNGGRSSDQNTNGYNNNQNGYGNNGNNNSNGSDNNRNQNGYGNNSNNNQNGYGNNNQNQNGSGNNDDGNGQQRGGVIPAGTRFNVRLEQTVRPGEAKTGDIIPGTLVNDVSVNGNVIAPSGTPVETRLTAVQAGSPGSLSLQLSSISVNGRRYHLASNAVHSLRDSQSSQNGNNGDGGGALGSVLGAIEGARQSNELPSGSVYTFRLISTARASDSRSNRDNQ